MRRFGRTAGGQDKRISQEIVLGIGGLRALKELGVQPTVYHMNEGFKAWEKAGKAVEK